MDIYVGNLAWAVDSDALRGTFEQHGEVASARVIMDKFTGKSKGFGFVEMPNEEEGNAAIEKLNGYELSGRPLRVNRSEPKQRDTRVNGGGGNGRSYDRR
ncbi:MAG: RNA-binding protein [Chitinispirillales bacterium]|jgi:RNA recognition motif-containing protein|nr:RNA-binding protein [Chitinispirillales bacterium]